MRRLFFAFIIAVGPLHAKSYSKDPLAFAFNTLRPRYGRFSLIVKEKESKFVEKKRKHSFSHLLLRKRPQKLLEAGDIILKASPKPSSERPNGDFFALLKYSKGLKFPALPKVLVQADPIQESVYKQELFEQVFGRKKQKSQKTFLNIFLEGKPLGLLPVRIDGSDVFFEAAKFMQRLKFKVKQDYYQSLQEKIGKQGSLSSKFLRINGLECVFDRSTMRLNVRIPALYRRLQRHSITGYEDPLQRKAQSPEPFSAYLNVHAEKSFVHSSADGLDSGVRPLSLGLFGTSRLDPFVLECYGIYREQKAPSFAREDLRLIYHRPQELLKFSFGDINHPSLGFQSARKMLGFELTKDYEMQPYLRRQPKTSRRFFLKNPAQVEVFVNGLRVQRMELPAGEHELSNFPLEIGVNDLQIHIQDYFGKEERIVFPFIMDAELLEEGYNQYSLSMGHPQKETNARNRRYDGHHATLSGFYRQGWNKSLTAGTYLQAEKRQLIAGLEGLRALGFGSVEFDFAYSRLFYGRSGYAFRSAFRNYLDSSDSKPLRYAVQAQYLSRYFAMLGNLEPLNATALDLSFNSSQDLGYGIFGGLGLSYRFLRNELKDPYNMTISFSKGWMNGLDSRMSLGQKRGSDRFIERSALISLSWAIPATNHSFRLNHSSLNDSVDFAWLNYPQKIHSFAHSVQFKRNDNERQYLLQGIYSTQRGKCKALFEAKELRGLYMTRQTKFSIDSAIAYVDGHLAVSRPISDSFAMIIPKATTKKLTIGANPSNEEYQAQTDFLGPAVLHQLGSYRRAKVYLESPDLPPGKDLGQSRYELLPSYRSGFAIYAGSAPTVVVKAKLLHADASPIALQLGKVFLKEDGEAKAIMFFTNREGSFVISRLKGGTWVLRLISMPEKELHIKIPRDFDGIYKLGNLSFKN